MSRCVPILSVMLLALTPAKGQNISPAVERATLSIRGHVMDVMGVGIPGVEVVGTNTQVRRVPRLTVTDESGDYALPGLAVGRYVVSTEFSGFLTERKEINLREGASNSVDFTLTVAAPYELTSNEDL